MVVKLFSCIAIKLKHFPKYLMKANYSSILQTYDCKFVWTVKLIDCETDRLLKVTFPFRPRQDHRRQRSVRPWSRRKRYWSRPNEEHHDRHRIRSHSLSRLENYSVTSKKLVSFLSCRKCSNIGKRLVFSFLSSFHKWKSFSSNLFFPSFNLPILFMLLIFDLKKICFELFSVFHLIFWFY